MAKNAYSSFSSCSLALLCAKLIEQDCCDGNITDPDSLSPFLDGPPTVYLKVNHDNVYPESYIQATNESLVGSKYLVMVTIYNETDTPDTNYNNAEFLWIQGNMTASTPGGVVSDNDTFVTLTNDTEPLLPYSSDFNLSEIVSNLRFDQTIWQLSVGVYQQTPELEDYLYTKNIDGGDPKQNQTLLLRRILLMFDYLEYGTWNPSRFWNSSSISPWGRVYCYAPGIMDSTFTATPTASSSSGGIGGASTSSSSPTATTSKGAANNVNITQIVLGNGKGMFYLFTWVVSALSFGLFL
ncbi:hypothetical protein BP6252_14001 [Coleophoma cylindrospora]|uniref:Uncharacterized protein n=1 Tax=Coleophoma cylindrospora TaxID=1849047 RepID=A0A3D8Q4G3_9HELO|nr:hypothetical protein BP6252_14001 [Coleophoma cylindrospora]